jgi:Sec-independent protein translocase protein TatA
MSLFTNTLVFFIPKCIIHKFSDAGDFLREIQKEEEEKAAQLKLEIKEEQLRLAEEAKKSSKKKVSKKKKKKVKAKKSEL